jgi:hypothetical protein
MDTASSHVMCARCGTVWTPIKIGSEGPICPKCNAPASGKPLPLLAVATDVATSGMPLAAAASEPKPTAAVPPADVPPVVPKRTPKRGPHLSPVPISVDDPVDDDDGYYSSRMRARDLEPDETSAYEPRRGMHPLLKLMLILILLVVLTPVVGVVLLFAVCAAIAAFGR